MFLLASNSSIKVIALLAVVLSLFPYASLACRGPRTPGQLAELLWGEDSGYDPLTRPNVAKQAAEAKDNEDPYERPLPDVTRVQWHILSLTQLDQKRNEYQLNVWFRRRWNDWRLKYNSSEDGGCFADDGREGFSDKVVKNGQIWSPDLYVENQAASTTTTAASVWIYPNGDVVYVTSLLLTLACKMNFRDFPHDTQRCGVRVGTFLEDAREVELAFWQNMNAVTLASNATKAGQLPHGGTNEWEIVSAEPLLHESNALHGATQAESTVEIELRLSRVSDYYFDFVIIPTCMFVMIGWSSFFISRTQAPARVTMSIVGFLANSNFLASQLGQLPRLGNDVWLLRFLSMSSMFSFYAVLEYVVCNHLLRIEQRVEGGRKRATEMVQAKQQRKAARRRAKKQANSSDYTTDEDDDVFQDEEAAALATPEITKKDMIKAGFNYKLDVWMLRPDGNMWFKDQHIDIFSRYFYPFAYGIGVTVLVLLK